MVSQDQVGSTSVANMTSARFANALTQYYVNIAQGQPKVTIAKFAEFAAAHTCTEVAMSPTSGVALQGRDV